MSRPHCASHEWYLTAFRTTHAQDSEQHPDEGNLDWSVGRTKMLSTHSDACHWSFFRVLETLLLLGLLGKDSFHATSCSDNR